MYTITDRFGNCPYDGFYIYAYKMPRADFIQRHQDQIIAVQPNSLRYHPQRTRKQAVWRHGLFLPVAGQQGALKVMWDPLVNWENMPLTRIYFNPSTTDYDAQQTYEVLLAILDDPLSAVMASLDTKVDFQVPYWLVAGHIYYPYARFVGHADWLPHLGTIYEGKATRLTIYAKAGDHGDLLSLLNRQDDEIPEPPITRVEMRQRFRKPRPTFGDFIRGELVDGNRMGSLKVVADLEHLGDRLLVDEALTRGGLTRALREYKQFANVSDADIQAVKDRINAIATREIFDLYRQQAEAWHSTFRG